MAVKKIKYCTLRNSTLIPPTEFLLSEDLDTTPSFILSECDQDLRVLRNSYEGLKSPKKVRQISKLTGHDRHLAGTGAVILARDLGV